jgi:nitroreductase
MIRKLLRPIIIKLHLQEKAQKLFLKYLAFKRSLNLFFIRFFAWSGMLSSFYYLLFSRAFDREHKAVLKGILAQAKTIRSGVGYNYKLIHNIHALEKGLSMKPRRDTFALEYIGETVSMYKLLIRDIDSCLLNGSQMKWVEDVLDTYFSVTSTHEIIEQARLKFYQLRIGDRQSATSKPREHDEILKSNFTYDQFYALTKQRRSVRWYNDHKVDPEIIDKAILAASQSPSACNRQPFEFRIFTEPEILKKLVNLPSGTKGFAENIRHLAVVVGSFSAYNHERDRHAIYIDGALAAMSFMFALETLGVSSCGLNWPDIPEREKAAARILDLEPHERPILFIAFGYADPVGMIPFSEKKPLGTIRRYNN